MSFDLKSADWTFEEGHQLGVQIGTINYNTWNWVPEPSGNTVRVSSARLVLDLQDPADDVATQGEEAEYLDRYVAVNSTTLSGVGKGSFHLGVSHS